MQKITSALATTSETAFFLTHIASSRNQKEEAEAARDTSLTERIESLELKIQSIMQENLRIEAMLNQTRALYQLRNAKNELKKKLILREIAPLEKQVSQLNTAIENKSKENLEFSHKIITETASRNHWRTIWTELYRLGAAD